MFHCALATESGYDSNVYFFNADKKPTGSAYLRVVPQLELGSKIQPDAPLPSWVYRIRLDADYRAYLQRLPEDGFPRHLGAVSLQTDLAWRPQGTFTIGIMERFHYGSAPVIGGEFWGYDGRPNHHDRIHAALGIDLRWTRLNGRVQVS